MKSVSSRFSVRSQYVANKTQRARQKLLAPHGVRCYTHVILLFALCCLRFLTTTNERNIETFHVITLPLHSRPHAKNRTNIM